MKSVGLHLISREHLNRGHLNSIDYVHSSFVLQTSFSLSAAEAKSSSQMLALISRKVRRKGVFRICNEGRLEQFTCSPFSLNNKLYPILV